MRKKQLCEIIDENKEITLAQCCSLLRCTYNAALAFLKKNYVPIRKIYAEVTCWDGRKQVVFRYFVDRRSLLRILHRMEKHLYLRMTTRRYKRVYKNKPVRIRSF